MASQEVLARTLVELADTLVDDFDVVDLMTLLADRCVEVFDVQDAGLMLAAHVGGQLRVMASSSPEMRGLELYELQTSEGPCWDCYHSGEPVFNQDLSAAVERWPQFAPAAMAAGVKSVSAIPMRLRGTTIGALNLFRTTADNLDPDDLAAARAFADVATIAVLQNQAAIDARLLNTQLNYALNSRIVIEQAKGMLAERANIEVSDAFHRLRGHARSHNLRLGTLAQDFIEGRVDLSTITTPPRR